jgi:hypothetical protein
MHCYQLGQICSTSLLEVVERIRCSADCFQEVVVRVVEVVDRGHRVVILVEEVVTQLLK